MYVQNFKLMELIKIQTLQKNHGNMNDTEWCANVYSFFSIPASLRPTSDRTPLVGL
jgi:hypothetical protein